MAAAVDNDKSPYQRSWVRLYELPATIRVQLGDDVYANLTTDAARRLAEQLLEMATAVDVANKQAVTNAYPGKDADK